MKRFFLVGLVGCIVAAAGFAAAPDSRSAGLEAKQEAAAAIVEKSFEGVTSVEIIALDPFGRESTEARAKDTAERLGRWKVTGKATLTNAAEIAKLKVALSAGILENDGSFALCFNPRHALRYRSGDSEVVMIICFECLQAVVSGIPNFEGALTSASPQKAFDEVFVAHGLTVAK